MNVQFLMPHEIHHLEKDEVVTEIDNLQLPPKMKNLLREIKDLIITRFHVFKDEIDLEEENNQEAAILMDLRTDSLGLKYLFYSDRLSNKMENSISENDYTLICRKYI